VFLIPPPGTIKGFSTLGIREALGLLRALNWLPPPPLLLVIWDMSIFIEVAGLVPIFPFSSDFFSAASMFNRLGVGWLSTLPSLGVGRVGVKYFLCFFWKIYLA
jgi:hypothetical protein